MLLFLVVLQYVSDHHLGKAAVLASIASWRREDMERVMTEEEQKQILAQFTLNVQALREAPKEMKQRRKRKALEQSRESTIALAITTATSFPAPTIEPASQGIDDAAASSPAMVFSMVDQFAQPQSALCQLQTWDLPLEFTPPARMPSMRTQGSRTAPPSSPHVSMKGVRVSSTRIPETNGLRALGAAIEVASNEMRFPPSSLRSTRPSPAVRQISESNVPPVFSPKPTRSPSRPSRQQLQSQHTVATSARPARPSQASAPALVEHARISSTSPPTSPPSVESIISQVVGSSVAPMEIDSDPAATSAKTDEAEEEQEAKRSTSMTIDLDESMEEESSSTMDYPSEEFSPLAVLLEPCDAFQSLHSRVQSSARLLQTPRFHIPASMRAAVSEHALSRLHAAGGSPSAASSSPSAASVITERDIIKAIVTLSSAAPTLFAEIEQMRSRDIAHMPPTTSRVRAYKFRQSVCHLCCPPSHLPLVSYLLDCHRRRL
jgi:hypothetical protein